ncbi:histidine phosphatase family protein [Paenibacillus doosanensis]|uniref:Bifunctional RNase H/acid phosphatase n=1 Tax=Paenibacillus konkukensis TaxID=2020716 RepID=A0ABY4RIZ1_9BACL|nr:MULTISPECIES: histidine phosphatase family protein [Paenibacillus]MCS7461655.1 histidine phosphatase family protein [Paenibacillus doosanensis]UQZ82080.1 bifunctional RNase H/acid phosphatase [Paenibacillus konkukensis]
MDIVFVRHGQGEHTQNIPQSYQVNDPGLTESGRRQAAELRERLPLTIDDAVIASPTRRTLQTAAIWCGDSSASRFAHPSVGPRQFPLKYDFQTLVCDRTMDRERIAAEFADFLLPPDVPDYIWLQGVNTLPIVLFETWAQQFLIWCKRLGKEKVYVVSHDGTIASYMQYITGRTLTRIDMLSEAEWFPVSV